MKKLAAFLTLAMIFAVSAGAFAADPSATFTLTPSATQLTLGETVTVTYKAKFANAGGKIAGLQNIVKYDTNVFEFVSASKGTELPSTTEPETGTAGEVGFGLTSLTGDAVSDNKDYVIGSMTLKVKSGAAFGTATLTQTETMFMLPDFEERTPSAQALSLTIAKAPTGTITITTTPAEGKWSIDGGSTWKDSGSSVSELALGRYKVTFKELAGYTKPEDISVELAKTAPTFTKSVTYTGKPGFIAVTFTPESIAETAQWSVDGETWYNGGTAQEIPSGAYTIQFKEIEGYETPAQQEITVEKDQTAAITAEYIEKPAISPAKAEFYKKSPEDLAFTLKGITAVTAVKIADEDLIDGEDYEYADGTLTVKQTVFAEKENGEYQLTVTTDKGDLTAAVKIADEKSSGSSGGCNAGFGALAMLFAAPLFYRKKK